MTETGAAFDIVGVAPLPLDYFLRAALRIAALKSSNHGQAGPVPSYHHGHVEHTAVREAKYPNESSPEVRESVSMKYPDPESIR